MIEETLDETIFVIPLDRLDKPLPSHTPESLRDIIFPNLQSHQSFQQNRDLLTLRAIQYLERFKCPSVEHITLPLDFSNIGTIFRCLSSFPGLSEIELLHPTTFNLVPHTEETRQIQEVLSASVGHFNHLTMFTVPLEVVSPLLLSHLGKLPNLQILSVKPRPSPYPIQASSLSPDFGPSDPSTFPGRKFLSLLQNLNLDGYFQALEFLDVGVRDPDDGFSAHILKKLFPKAMIL